MKPGQTWKAATANHGHLIRFDCVVGAKVSHNEDLGDIGVTQQASSAEFPWKTTALFGSMISELVSLADSKIHSTAMEKTYFIPLQSLVRSSFHHGK